MQSQRLEPSLLLSFLFPIKKEVDHPSTPTGWNQKSFEFIAKILHRLIVDISSLCSMVEEESLKFTYETGKCVLAKVWVLRLIRAPHSCKIGCDECWAAGENSVRYFDLYVKYYWYSERWSGEVGQTAFLLMIAASVTATAARASCNAIAILMEYLIHVARWMSIVTELRVSWNDVAYPFEELDPAASMPQPR
jgi:hypothetical protein